MNAYRLFTLAAVAALAASQALAHGHRTLHRHAAYSAPDMAPAAEDSGMDSNVILESSPTPPSEAYRLVASDPTVVSNGPVPDTPQNRARYGGPMSHGGRMTAPAGN
ncbi:MAG TPA: hypothetical protein VG939_08085 [Caulobacteraceae bacterium]|nr:hypothetical protein [Caulobacteraceae bacterium]